MRTFRLVLLGLACLGSLGLILEVRLRPAESRPEKTVRREIAGVWVRDAAGRAVALGPRRAGAVLVVSYTCPHCHTSLERIARASRGDTLPGLQVVTMEGPEKGATLLAELAVRAQALGPGDVTAFAKDLDVQAVPLVLETDATGAVVGARVGALSEGEATALVRRTAANR